MFSAKTNLENDEVPISKALIDLYVSPYKFVLVNNVLREIIKRKKKKNFGKKEILCNILNKNNKRIVSAAKKNSERKLERKKKLRKIH